LRQRHLKPIDLQRGAGIPAASQPRIFKYGSRATFLNNLDKLAVFFGVRSRELLGEPLQVSVVGEVTATKGFDYSKVDKIFPCFTVPCLAGLMLKDVERMNGLQVADHSMEEEMKTLYLWLIGNLDTHKESFQREETIDYTFRKVGRGFLSKTQRHYIYTLAWA